MYTDINSTTPARVLRNLVHEAVWNSDEWEPGKIDCIFENRAEYSPMRGSAWVPNVDGPGLRNLVLTVDCWAYSEKYTKLAGHPSLLTNIATKIPLIDLDDLPKDAPLKLISNSPGGRHGAKCHLEIRGQRYMGTANRCVIILYQTVLGYKVFTFIPEYDWEGCDCLCCPTEAWRNVSDIITPQEAKHLGFKRATVIVEGTKRRSKK